MLDFSLDKILVIVIVAAIVVGPKRLPSYATKVAQVVKRLRTMVDGAHERVRDELGPEYQDVDWKKLDPRQYDPRQIIRDSLMGDVGTSGSVPAGGVSARLPNPFDDDGSKSAPDVSDSGSERSEIS